MEHITRYMELLKSHYGVVAEDIEAVRGGWSAAAYKVRSSEGTYFLKVYDRTKPSVLPWIARMDGYLPAAGWMERHAGFGAHIPRLCETLNGGLRVPEGEEILLLFEFAEGTVPGETPLTPAQTGELAAILAGLHSVPPEAPPFAIGGLTEDISMSFCEKLKNLIEQPDSMPEGLRDVLVPFEGSLRFAADTTLALRDSVRKPCQTLCLCHTDAHNWNLISWDRLYLLDWEGLCIAPPEADLFLFCEKENFAAFMDAYKAHREGFELNEQMLFFYRFRRKMEDIWEFAARVMFEDGEPVRKSYAALRQECGRVAGLIREYDGSR